MTKKNNLKNHQITIALSGGVTLGPFRATWTTEVPNDVRELTKDYDAYLKGQKQTRFRYHLHDSKSNQVHSVVLSFANVTAIYDRVKLRKHS